MPYIKQEHRKELDFAMQNISGLIYHTKLSAGDLNYIISRLIWLCFDLDPSYANANTLMGVLTGVQSEFYRRKVASYEDIKLEENGDLEI